MQEHVSTQKCILDPGEDKFPGSTGMQDLLPSPRQGMCVCHLWKARPARGDRASPHLCHGGYTCFAGAGGLGAGQGGCDFLATSQAPPCVVRWPRVAVCEHTTSRVSRGWEEGGGGRRHEGTGFWGTNPHRNSLREPTCVQGGKKTSPCTWENTPPREKAHLHVGKYFHVSTHRRRVSRRRRG